MTKDEALKLALEALEYRGVGSWRKKQPAITAIKQALANDALEKKAENARELGLMPYDGGDYEPEKTVCPFCTSEWVTAEQHDRNVDRVERTPLTDKDIASIFKAQRLVYNTDGVPFARAIEAAHNIKENT